jgi:hypothetical protein
LTPHNEPNLWRLAWGPEQLPQRIDVVFTGRSDDSSELFAGDDQHRMIFYSSSARLAGPLLKGLIIEHEMWTIHPLRPDVIQTWSMAGPVQQERDRLQKKINVLNLPANIIAENTPADLARWYLPWARRQVASVGRLDYLERRFGPVRNPKRDFGEKLPAQRQQWDARLGGAVVNQEAAEQADRVFAPAALFAPMCGEPAIVACESRSDPSSALKVQAARPKASLSIGVGLSEPARRGLGGRLLACLVVLTAIFAFWFLLRKRWHGDLLVGSPRLAGVLLGLAWWLWLSPSILGWLIVLLSLVPAARPLVSTKNESDTSRLNTKGLPLNTVVRQ